MKLISTLIFLLCVTFAFAECYDNHFDECRIERQNGKYGIVIDKQQGIYISVAPNPRAELEETVRLIRRMVREEGMRYQDFAVLTGDLSVYGTYAREIFEKCGGSPLGK